MSQERMEEPKTMGECWEIYTKFGFKRPQLPLDKSTFPNAILLVRMHNERVAELTKGREANQRIVPDLSLMSHNDYYQLRFLVQEFGADYIVSAAEHIKHHLDDVKKLKEGNEPNEGT